MKTVKKNERVIRTNIFKNCITSEMLTGEHQYSVCLKDDQHGKEGLAAFLAVGYEVFLKDTAVCSFFLFYISFLNLLNIFLFRFQKKTTP
jgi:hypothetical protein